MKRCTTFIRYAAASWLLALAAPQLANACTTQGCIMAGPRLASLDSTQGALLNTLLGGLLGSSVSINVADWNTLAAADIKVADFLNALSAQGVGPTPMQALTATTTLAQALTAAASAATTEGDVNLAAKINAIKVPLSVPVGNIVVGDLLKLTNAPGNTSINALDLITGLVQTFNRSNVATTPTPVSVNVGAIPGLTGVTSINLYAQVVEPPVYTCGPQGTQFHTAAIRIKLNVTLPAVAPSGLGVSILGISVTASSVQLLNNFNLYIEVARADGTIGAINALTNAFNATAIPGVVDIYLGSIPDATFFNRSRSLTYADFGYASIGTVGLSISVVLVVVPVTVNLTGSIDMRAHGIGQAPSSSGISMLPPYPKTQTITTSATFVSNLASSLLSSLDVRVSLSPDTLIGAILTTLTGGVTTLVAPLVSNLLTPVISPILSAVVDPLLGALGIKLGQAVYTVYGVFSLCSVSGNCYADVNHNASREASEAGTAQTLYAKLVSTTRPTTVYKDTVVDPTTGAYSFTSVVSDNYTLLIDTNTTASDVTATRPSGWVSTEQPTFSRSLVVSGMDPTNQNFGLFNGSSLSGRVIRDDGAGSGTANDGIKNGTEAYLPGSTLKATNSAGSTTYDTTVASDSGQYTLYVPASAGASAVKIVETNPPTYVSVNGTGGTTSGSYDRPTDTVTFTNAVGSTYTGVNFADVLANSFITDGRQVVLPGTVALYTHAFTAGTVGQLTLSGSSPSMPGWSYLIFRDTNCNGAIDSGESAVSGAIATTSGLKVCLVVKVLAPVTAPYNTNFPLTVSASFAYTGISMTDAQNRNDLTITGDGKDAGLRLTKAVDKSTAKSGDTLSYTITYFNAGDKALTVLKIYDFTPPYTVFGAAACGTPLPTGLTSCTLAAQPAAAATGNIRWDFAGSLNPGGTGTVTFSVTLQ